MSDIVRRAEATARGKQDPQTSEKAPPRQNGMPSTPSKGTGRTDVSICSDAKDRVHLEVDTPKGRRGAAAGSGSGGWPRDGEEWKRLLSKAAPWLAAAAAVVAVAAIGQSQRENGETVGDKARRGRDRAAAAAEEGAEGAKRGWFGFKRRTEGAAESAGDKAWEAKHATSRKADEAKGAVSRAAEAAADTARGAADAARGAAGRAAERTVEAAEGAKAAVRDSAEGAKRGAADLAASVKEGAEGAAGKAAKKGDTGFFGWKEATKGVKEQYRHEKEEAARLSGRGR